MKTRHFIYIFLMVFSAVSCRKEPVVQPAPEEISFAAPAVAQTKSVLITDVEGMKSAYNMLAYAVFASHYIPDEGGNITNHHDFINDLKVYSEDNGNTWKYDGNKYYWSPGAAYKFFAVYPYYDRSSNQYDLGISYSIDEAKHALKVTGKHESGTGDEPIICTGNNGKELCPDILYGVRAFTEPYRVGEDRGAVNFTMHHALSAVSFRLRNATDNYITKITTDYISGFMNASDHVWLSENGAEWATPKTVTDKAGENFHKFKVPDFNTGNDAEKKISQGAYYPDENSYWCTMLMIPQNFGTYQTSPSFRFTVTMSDSSTKTYTIDFKDYAVNNVAEHAYAYLPGYHYIYSFNVTATKITCDINVVPWIEDEFIELN